ncbi:MAG: adenylyltransferase/cytidyltransferase family protein [bacterium]|nr:adenylyltransferase/cytidyltransferase family protein [bacterium]
MSKPKLISIILTLADLAKRRKHFTNVVLVGGVFDILHSGHVNHLKQAKKYGDVLIVHVVGNKRVREKKGPSRPVFDEKERAYIIAALKYVDYVFIYNSRHYDQKIINLLQPDILFFNQEGYTTAISNKVAKLRNFKGKIIVDKQDKINNSSKIIKRIQNN